MPNIPEISRSSMGQQSLSCGLFLVKSLIVLNGSEYWDKTDIQLKALTESCRRDDGPARGFAYQITDSGLRKEENQVITRRNAKGDTGRFLLIVVMEDILGPTGIFPKPTSYPLVLPRGPRTVVGDLAFALRIASAKIRNALNMVDFPELLGPTRILNRSNA
jgi:hypothetical protein